MDDHLELLLNGQLYKKLNEIVYKPVTNTYNLSMLEIKVLLFLKEHTMYDTARDIVEVHYLTKSYVSKAIDTLIEKGYLKRKQDTHDRRCIHLEMQEKALPVIDYVKIKQKELGDFQQVVKVSGLWLFPGLQFGEGSSRKGRALLLSPEKAELRPQKKMASFKW